MSGVRVCQLLVGLVVCAALLPACSKPAPPVPPPKPAQSHAPARHISPPAHRVTAETTNADGAWLVGTFMDTRRAPLTNVTACWRSNDTETTLPLPLSIEADGGYVTAPMPTGICTVSFAAPHYHPVVHTVPLATMGPVIREVLFAPIQVVTCTVLDAVSRLPIADVEVDIMGHNENTSHALPRTDMQGIVLIECQPSPIRAEFRHPRYAPSRTIIWVNELNKVMLLSGAGALVARVLNQAGMPETNVYVALECFGDRFPMQKVQADGTALFTNLPAHSSPFAARVRDASLLALASATNLCVTAGTMTYADITLPACGSLLVRCPTGAVVYELSGTVREETLNGWSERGAFSYGDFEQRDDGWFLGRVPARAYRVSISLRNSPAFTTTNLTILPDQLTILDVASAAPSSTGVIAGFVHDLCGTGQECVASALTGTPAVLVAVDYSVNGAFAIGKLDAHLTYAVRVSVAGFTNVVVDDVLPNGPPLDIEIPAGFKVSGIVVDNQGVMLHASVRLTPAMPANEMQMDVAMSMLRKESSAVGEFSLEPVGPGEYNLNASARGCVAATRPITITNRDLDVGEIVLDHGLTVCGRVIDATGNPVANATVLLFSVPFCNDFASTDYEGRFRLTGIAPHIQLNLSANAGDRGRYDTLLDGLAADTDLGDITIGSPIYLVLTLRTHAGRPAQGIYLGNTASDAQGNVEGVLAGRTDFVTLLKKPMRELRQMPASSDFFRVRFQPGREMTNFVTATLPADFVW